MDLKSKLSVREVKLVDLKDRIRNGAKTLLPLAMIMTKSDNMNFKDSLAWKDIEQLYKNEIKKAKAVKKAAEKLSSDKNNIVDTNKVKK